MAHASEEDRDVDDRFLVTPLDERDEDLTDYRRSDDVRGITVWVFKAEGPSSSTIAAASKKDARIEVASFTTVLTTWRGPFVWALRAGARSGLRHAATTRL